MMLSILVYLVLLSLLAAAAWRVAQAAQRLRISASLAACIAAAFLPYVACLLPGVLGLLYTPVVYLVFALLSIAVLVCLRRLPADSRPRAADRTRVAPTDAVDFGLVFVGLLVGVPFLGYLRWSVPAALRDPAAVLPWDTVSYHIPAFIGFWQDHTLWSLDGPFQSYSFAFELIGNFFSQPFFTHWGLVVTHLFALAFLLMAMATVMKGMIPRAGAAPIVHWIPPVVLSIGLWSSIFPEEIAEIGKNDVFMTACLLAALALLLELADDEPDGRERRRWPLLALLSTSLGLAVAAKPSALAFVPYFALAAPLAILGAGTHPTRRRSQLLGASLLVLATCALLAGFWLCRNLAVFGRLSPVEGAWKLSLVANLHNPALYVVKRGSVLFGLGVCALLPGLLLAWFHRRSADRCKPLFFVLGFLAVACGAYAVTPHAIFHEDLTRSVWKLRLGMPLFAAAVLVYALFAAALIHAARQWNRMARTVLVGALAGVLALALPLRWHAHAPSGLPGYEQVKVLPRTDIYGWVQRQAGSLRLYSAGLRPYGLYGACWENRLFYDLHSVGLSPLADGRARIAAVVVSFKPHVILISVDPHPNIGPPVKPEVVEWMKSRPECFEEVFRDETVSGFKVLPGAAAALMSLVPAGYELKMGS
jgi:hypothetical protein